MPYCSQCGTEVTAADRFCGRCGSSQQAGSAENSGRAQQTGASGSGFQAPPPPPATDLLSGLSDRNISMLCYIPWFGWIGSIIVLATQRFRALTPQNRTVRFHAFQGLYLFVAWLLVDWVVAPMLSISRFSLGFPRPLGGLLHLLVLAAWIVMLIKTANDERYRLPIIGDLAERAVDEQRV